MLSLQGHVAQVLQAHGMVLPGQTVLVAVSGGADSVALLCLLCDLAPKIGFSLQAAHLDHGIRGAAARGDAFFVQSLCQSLSVPCTLGYEEVPLLAQERGQGLEEAARVARYRFLEKTRSQTGAACIAVAHHQEDQAETVLMHLLRGAGLSGLTGMQPVSGRVVRPLLYTPASALRHYLRQRQQPWRQDASNFDPAYGRNALRHQLLPLLKTIAPQVVGTLSRTAQVLQLDEEALQEALDQRRLPEPVALPYGGCVPWWDASEVPAALMRRYLKRVLGKLGFPSPEQQHLQALEQLLRTRQGAVALPGGSTAWAGGGFLHLIRREAGRPAVQPVLVPAAGEAPLWMGLRLAVRPAKPYETGDGVTTQVMRAALLGRAVVRTAGPGDRFAPLGQRGHKELRRAMTDRKIDRPLRPFWPVVAAESSILWLCGRLPGEALRVAGGEPAVLLSLKGPMTWMQNTIEEG